MIVSDDSKSEEAFTELQLYKDYYSDYDGGFDSDFDSVGAVADTSIKYSNDNNKTSQKKSNSVVEIAKIMGRDGELIIANNNYSKTGFH